MCHFEFQTRTRLVFGEGSIERLGELARGLGFRRTLLVADHGLVDAGHVAEATAPLVSAGIEVVPFHDFEANPDTAMIERGRCFAASAGVDSMVGLGGGSSMDCAKGINFVLTNGGSIRDYHGYGKASRPMLPMIGIPTTAGTGSEAQSYALISDADSHMKMACGDPKAAFKIAILDPVLTVSEPSAVRAASGYDAISHAVESFVTTARNPASELFAREAWRLLDGAFERVMNGSAGIQSLGEMQLGAHYAGVAIEHSMLGATHACANPLTAHYGTAHGVAIAALLSHVVRWNQADRYAGLCEGLDARLEQLAEAAGLPTRLSAIGVPRADLELLSAEAAQQWTGRFNPRPFDAAGALEIYQCAY
ncbi:MAG TPA: iron-containing alcohol dehydrogenase [Bryobacteraceae bacterium]|nr:iron-containing alcohol dehydrogenase [Bryobacteraceae bacterium]